MPSKKEIKVLKYLYKAKDRYDVGMKGDKKDSIKTELFLNDDDLSDMHGSELLYFSSNPIVNPIICITNRGNVFIENYRYGQIKEFFYWIFGISSVVAGVFAVWAVLKK